MNHFCEMDSTLHANDRGDVFHKIQSLSSPPIGIGIEPEKTVENKINGEQPENVICLIELLFITPN